MRKKELKGKDEAEFFFLILVFSYEIGNKVIKREQRDERNVLEIRGEKAGNGCLR